MNESDPAQSRSEKEIFFEALDKNTPQERAAFLDGACGKNPVLRARVEALLADHFQKDGFMEKPAAVPREEAVQTIKLGGAVKPNDEAVGQTIGRYKLLEKLGEGGCGAVYVAQQNEPVRRRVALKVIKLGMDTKEVIARFEAERQALAMMDHPNIAKVFDAGTTETGRPYFVMELVRGIKITEYCDQNQLNTKQRLALLIEVCRAVQHAHQKGIIHRDIKPSNIMVTLHDGVPVPKVIDFGIAKATEGRLTAETVYTQLHQFIGTPAYMSPEQAEMSGLDIDTRSDIYSLGVLLYELLAGSTPFDAKELMASGLDAMRKIIREQEPVRPSTRFATLQGADLTTTAKRRSTDTTKLLHQIKGDLDWIVMKCLEKDRTRRYETANGLAFDLLRHINNEPVLARPQSNVYRFQKMARRHKGALTAAALMAAVLVAATCISAWQAVRATRAEKLAAGRLIDSENSRTEAEANATLAQQRLAESEAISQFLIEVFQSPDPARDGRAVTVAETLGAAAKKLETDLTNQPARRARLQGTLGRTYSALGLFRDAIPLQEKARDYYLAAHGLENSDTIACIHNLAVSYAGLGRRDEALKLREQVLELRRKVNGPENPDTIKAMGNLAISYYDYGRLDDALKLCEQVLPLSRKVLGPENPGTVTAMNHLASCYDHVGRLDEAVKLREEALTLSRKVLGPEKLDTLVAMNNLANSYARLGRREEALKLREQTLAISRKICGPEHPDTLKVMGNLADSYDDAGRGDEALKLKEQVLSLTRNVLGPEHPDTLAAMNNVARSYGSAARWDEAIKLEGQALSLCNKVRGPEHPDTLMAMNNLAVFYRAAGRPEDALKLQEEVLVLRRKVSGPEHPDTLMAMDNLATFYRAAGRPEDALKLQEQVLALDRKVSGPEHPDTLHAMGNLAISYEEAGRRDEILKLREEMLPLSRKVNGPEHPDTLMAMNNLTTSYFEAGRNKEAISLLKQSCALDPKNTDASLTLATWQTWLGQDADYEATRRRLVQLAEGTDEAGTAERAAKACCLRPSTDSALLTKALDLAQRGVELGKTNSLLPYYQLGLGLAEYRNGQYAAAERTLTIAEQTIGKDPEMLGVAGLYRAMSLFRQQKPEEARRLFSQAEAQMPPLPTDESKPLVDGKPVSHDVLICWLAYKEAKALIEGNSTAGDHPK